MMMMMMMMMMIYHFTVLLDMLKFITDRLFHAVNGLDRIGWGVCNVTLITII